MDIPGYSEDHRFIANECPFVTSFSIGQGKFDTQSRKRLQRGMDTSLSNRDVT